MSINTQMSISCPSCGAVSETTVWRSITVSDSPDLKRDILSGKINMFECGTCGTRGLLPEPLLYHDEEKRLMITLSPTNDPKRKAELFKELTEASKASGELEEYSGYNLRFVTDINDLMEKILIFDAGLSDKAAELIKLMILSQDKESAEHRYCRFGKKTADSLEFMVCDTKDGKVYTSQVPRQTYDTIYEQMILSGVKPYSFGWETVDAEYASKLLGA